MPGRLKDVDRLGEDVVVDEAGVDGENRHQENQVTTTEKDLPNFRVDFLRLQLLFFQTHPDGKGQNNQSVSGISEHDSEEKWESDDGEDGRVRLLVGRDAVSVDQLLKCRSKFVGPEESWGSFNRFHLVENGTDGGSTLRRTSPERHLDLFQIGSRDPAFGDQTLLGHVQVEQIQGVVDGFDLADLDEPPLDFFGGLSKDCSSKIVRLFDDGI